MTEPHEAKELRLAIAIRGGVSLAVWMGGAVGEIVRLHRASRDQSGTYARLLVACGYTTDDGQRPQPVVIDVLAGTSAGGLNAALLAAHLVYGVPFDAGIRNIWLQIGDLELLSRSPKEKSPQSLLEGDRVFYEQMRIGLQKLARGAKLDTSPEAESLKSLRLILTATRLTPRADSLRPDLGNALAFHDSRAHFRFRYRQDAELAGAHGPLSDFGLDDDARNTTLERLAYAARATSSFPGAFEPARIRVGDLEHGNVDGGLPLDFHGVSSETQADTGQTFHEVDLIDGGVLDNIPIDWALRAIAGSPTIRAVDRWLLYLEPVPKRLTPPHEITVSERRATWIVRTVVATLGAKGQASSMLRNADEFRSAQEEVSHLTSLADTGALSAKAAAVIEQASEHSRIDAYQDQIRAAEGIRAQRLIEEPLSVIGPDPLAVPALGYPMSELDRAGLSTRFLSELCRWQGELAYPDAENLHQVRQALSPLPIARAVTLLGNWLCVVEKPDDACWAVLRQQLSEARFAAEVLVATSDRFLLQAVQDAVDEWTHREGERGLPAGASLPAELDAETIAQDARQTFRRALSWVSMPQGFDKPWHTWATALALLLPTLSQPDLNPAGDGLDDFWRLLAQLAVDIGVAASGPSPHAGSDPFAALREAATDHHAHQRSLDVLTAAEVLLGPLRSHPFAESGNVRLAALSAAVISPLEKDIFAEPLPTDATRVDRKLSGNQVHNFAAFVSSRWRLNDWTWGRLDASRSLAEIIVDHRAAEREFTASETADLFCGGDLDPEWKAFLDRKWRDFGITDGSVSRQRVVEIVTARLQWEILAEEMPLMTVLAGEEANVHDESPTDETLRAAEKITRLVEPPSVDDGADRLSPADVADAAQVLGRIGTETIRDLIVKKDLRRSILRLGLVAWRALLPSGTDPRTKAGRVFLNAFEPIAWLPLLFGVAAPLLTIIAGLVMLVAVAVTVDHWASVPADVIIITGIFIAIGISWWQRWKKKPSGRVILVVVLVALATYTASIAVWLNATTRLVAHPNSVASERAGVAAGCVLVATLAPLVGVLRPKNLRAWFFVGFTGLISAAAGFVAAWITAIVGDQTLTQDWIVLLLLYVPFAAERWALHRRYPEPERRMTATADATIA
jgi:patatin-related protein